jgi:glycosyltransferase 2 family protein
MKKLLQPRVLTPAILSVALLAVLFTFADARKVLHLMSGFQHIYLLYYLLLMIAYEVVRGLQWHFLLKALDLHVPLRAQIFAFAMGETTKSLPIGNYFQNYVLQQSKGADFGRTSAATTLIVLTEVAVSLVGVVIIGLGSWSSWLRPLIIVGTAVVVLCGWLFTKLYHARSAPQWMTKHEALRKILDELRQFREGTRDLLRPRVLAIQVSLGSMYLAIAGIALYVVIRGLGLNSVSLWQAWAVYFFSLAVGLIFPLPVDIGVTEISGVGALVAIGVDRSYAVGIMLINRVLSIGASVAIALIVVVVLHDEFRATLRGGSKQPGRRSPERQHAGSR